MISVLGVNGGSGLTCHKLNANEMRYLNLIRGMKRFVTGFLSLKSKTQQFWLSRVVIHFPFEYLTVGMEKSIN